MLLGFAGQAVEAANSKPVVTPRYETLASTAYVDKDVPHVLALRKYDALPLWKLRPDLQLPSYVNTFAVLLVDISLAEPKKESMLFLVYKQDPMPVGRWAADVSVRAQTNEAYVTVLIGFQWDIWLSVYRVKLTEQGTQVPDFDPDKPSEWPKPASPLATLHTGAYAERAGGIRRLQAFVEGEDSLLIYYSFEKRECPGLYFRLMFQPLTWFAVTHTNKEAERLKGPDF